MLLAHHPELLASIRVPSTENPLRVLVSACLAGDPCGVEGTDYGLGPVLRDFLALPTVRAVRFCPENFAMGTPRTMPDIHGGDGRAVLAGRARVLDEKNTDLTEKMLLGARRMLEIAREHDVELAVLTDMSAACGTQVISDGCRLVEKRAYQRGLGVAAAMLLDAGFHLVAQRDHRTIGRIREKLQPGFSVDTRAIDHHEGEWYRGYFRTGAEHE